MLKNLIATGKPQSDPAIIEVSLKLASIYARLGKKELAITGYQWSADTCRKNIQEMKKKKVPSSSKGSCCKCLIVYKKCAQTKLFILIFFVAAIIDLT